MVKSKSAYSVATKKEKLDTHIIVVWVDNEAGVLSSCSWFIFWKRLQY